jgi:hypothetical protein
MTLVIDGTRLAACADFNPRPHALLWPSTHEIVPVAAKVTP